MEKEITVSIGLIITIVGFVGIPLAGVIRFLYRRIQAISKAKDDQSKADRDVIISLSKSFIESQKDSQRVIENNTKALEKLPEHFLLLMKANKNGG